MSDATPNDVDKEEESNSGEDDGSIEGDAAEKEPEIDTFREELSHVSFEDLQKLQGKIGAKRFREMISATNSQTKQRRFSRENKNRPMEMSSKRPVKMLREAGSVKRKIHRDPRFDDLSGTFNETFFKNAYSFIGDIKTREKEKVAKQLTKEHDPSRKAAMATLLQRMSEQEKREQEKEKRAEKDRELKKVQLARVHKGAQPYFMKKSDKKVLELADKYKKLKESGNLDKYLSKKRKKNASRDRKALPPPAQLE